MVKKQIFGVFLALIIIFSWGAIYLYFNRVESDSGVIAEFNENRVNLERAVEMAHEDTNVTTISNDYVLLNGYESWRGDSDKRFSTSRWNEYKEVLRKPGKSYCYTLSKDKDGVISFSTASSSSSYIDDYESLVISKNYAFSLVELKSVTSSLDWMGNGAGYDLDKRIYRKIDRNWFIFVDVGVSKPE